jgi:hypothetical protein
MFHPFPLNRKSTLIVGLLFVGMDNFSSAGPVLLQDAYTAYGKKTLDQNYGNAAVLNVVHGEAAFLHFAVNAYFPEGTVGQDVAKATLKVFVNSVTAVGRFKVLAVNEPWTETGITAKNKPAIDTQVIGSKPIGPAADKQWISVDITPLVQNWVDGIRANHGVVLVADKTISVAFDSKESTTSSHAPEIEIIMAKTTGAMGLTGATGATGQQGLKGDTGATGPQGHKG